MRLTTYQLPITCFLIAAAALITYHPAFRIGFLDGWWYLDWVSRMDLPRYAIQFLDPANITQGYRPVQGLYILVVYTLFKFNPDGYHLAHTLLHAANGVLLFAITRQLTRNWHVAMLAALLYVVSPVYAFAVFWHAVVDPISAFFYLLTIWLWTRYLEFKNTLNYALTWLAFLFALFSKEVAIFLPLMLFLIEWWFYGYSPNFRALSRRFALFVLPIIPYLALVAAVQNHGEFVGQFRFSVGPHMLISLANYLAVLAFPWLTARPTDWFAFAWLAIAALVFLFIVVRAKSARLLFLAIFAALNIAPLTGFPLDYFDTRYLYLSLMASLILFALLFHHALARYRTRVVATAAACVIALMVMGSSAMVADAASGLAEYTRQLRVPFRDISRAHPSFPNDTYLYFVYSPKTPLVDLQGLFLTRYGTELRVSGTEDTRPARLRGASNTFVYYFDDADRPREIVVDKNEPRVFVPLPLDLNAPIRLEGIEIVNPAVNRDDPLIVLLYWRATGKIEKDYTVFVHWIDAQGKAIGGVDNPPRRGSAPTSEWTLNQFVVDALVVPVEEEMRAGENYRVQIGMYYLPTLEQLSFVDAQSKPLMDSIMIEPIQVQ